MGTGMTKAAAIQEFWSSFGLPAFEENAVPAGGGTDGSSDAPEFPYITYEFVSDDLGAEVAMTASVWYRGPSWVPANAKSEEIGARIGYGGILLSCDGGRIWIRRGSPFSQPMGDESDDMIRRKVLGITAMYLTNL